MENLIFFLKKTVGQKVVIGLTGLGLCVFLLFHMLGNLFILKGEKAYNIYAHNLHEFFLLEFLEIGLFAFFIGHIILASLVNVKNWKAKEPYVKKAEGEKKTSFSNRALVFQGVVLLLFLAGHLLTFKYGVYYEVVYEGKTMRNIYLLVYETFKNPFYVLAYVFSLFVLGAHLIHGLSASLRTLGFYHPNYTPWFEKISLVFGLLVTLGFVIQPLYIFLIL